MKHPHLWLRAISVVAIIAVMVALPGASSPASTQQAWPAAGIAYAEKIDQEVWKALEKAPDGKVAVLVKLAEQADLSAASGIEDWNARWLGRFQRPQLNCRTHTARRDGAHPNRRSCRAGK